MNNFFLKNDTDDIHSGTFTINNGVIDNANFLIDGQYFRIVGSKLNDGVYQYNSENIDGLKNETFKGALWDMSVPPDFVKLCEKIDNWNKKYGGADSAALSPFVSESFDVYSYSKGSFGRSGDGSANSNVWQGVFCDDLKKWRRLNRI